jgi:hypothetical protein
MTGRAAGIETIFLILCTHPKNSLTFSDVCGLRHLPEYQNPLRVVREMLFHRTSHDGYGGR